jgi:autotransporter-associated beta strand protein
VTALSINGSSDTINVSAVPGLGQFQLISYGGLIGAYDFVLGTLPPGFQGYLSNNAAGFSVDIVITNSLAKTDIWRGNVNGNWDTSTLNWLSSGGPSSFQQGDDATFDDTLTGTANVILTLPVLPGSVLCNNSSHNYVFSGTGKLGGTGALTKQGTGSLTLTETGGDNLSGGIIASGGTLVLDNAGSALSGGMAIGAGGTVQIGNNDANGGLPSGSVTVDGSLVFNRNNSLAVATPIAGNGSLAQNGTGTLSLSGANSYSGNTYIYGGTLSLSGAGNLSNSAVVYINNATLDVSALSQSTGLNVMYASNAAAITLAVIPGSANIGASSLFCGGPLANRINVSSFPPIASYPVTFTVVQAASISGFNFTIGTLPVATPPYTANVSQSADQTAVLLTVTGGPTGTRPSVSWSGADVPNLNTNWSDRLNWQLPGAPGGVDNVTFNATDAQSSSAVSPTGGGSAALVGGNINNIVDANFTISSMTYTNLGGTYHNTYINNGKTLSVTNTGGLNIGTLDSGSSLQSEFATISGANATLNVSNATGNFQIWMGNNGSQGILDLSALDNLSVITSRLLVGATINNVVNRPSGVLYLAKTNSISAGFQTTTIESGTTTANAGIVVADCNGNAGSPSSFYLGQVNTISADTIAFGRQKTTAHVLFNSIYANLAPYPTVTFQGFSSGSVSSFDVGDGVGNTGTTTATGDLNLTGGRVTASIGTMNVGRASGGATGSGKTTGLLQFDAGTITANTLNIGLQPVTGSKTATGMVSVASNTVIGAAAHLLVNGSLNLAFSVNPNSSGAALNITNGEVLANTIAVGTNSDPTTSAIGVYGGMLALTNAGAGNADGPLGSLNLAPLGTPDNLVSRIRLRASFTPAITVSNLNLDGQNTTANTIDIGSVAEIVSTPVELPLIQYGSFNLLTGTTTNLGLGALPPTYAAYLTNDTTQSQIALVVTTAPTPRPPRITSIVESAPNLVLSGDNGLPDGLFYLLVSTDPSLPIASWTNLGNFSFDPSGNFTITIPIGTGPHRFFRVQVP